MEDEPVYMVCMRVDQLEEPVEGSTTTACVDCGADIWISVESRKEATKQGAMPLCTICAKKIADDENTSVDMREFGRPSAGQFDELVRNLKKSAMQYGHGEATPAWLKGTDGERLDTFEAMKQTARMAQEKMVKPDDDWGSMVIMVNFEDVVYPPVPLGKMLGVGIPKDVLAQQLIPGLAHTAQAKRVLFGLGAWSLAGDQVDELDGPISEHADRKEVLVLIDVTADGVQRMARAEIIRDGVGPPKLGEWHDAETTEASTGLFVDALVPALKIIKTIWEGSSV